MPKVQLDIQIDSHGNVQGVERINSALDTLGRKGSITQERLAAASRGADQLATQGMVAGGAMLYLGGQAINAASDVEEMRGKFSVVFGDQAAQVTAWSEEQAGALNRSKYDLQEYASTFQDTFVPMGFARSDAAELSKQLATLGVDMASFNNTTDTQAINDLQSALVGNHETMRKYGVVITEATLNAQLLEMGIQGGTRAATEQQKVQARLQLILKGTSDAQGDAERTSDSYANQMRGLQAAVKDAQVEIGSALIPVLKDVIPPLAETVTDIVEFCNTPFGQTVAKAALALSGMAFFGGTAYKAISTLKSTVEAGKAILAWLGGAANKNAEKLDMETAALDRNTAAQEANATAAGQAAAARGAGGTPIPGGGGGGTGTGTTYVPTSGGGKAPKTPKTPKTPSGAKAPKTPKGGSNPVGNIGIWLMAIEGAREAYNTDAERMKAATGEDGKTPWYTRSIVSMRQTADNMTAGLSSMPNNLIDMYGPKWMGGGWKSGNPLGQVGDYIAPGLYHDAEAATGDAAAAGADATTTKVDVNVKIDGSGDEIADALANNATMTTKMEEIAGDETYKANRR